MAKMIIEGGVPLKGVVNLCGAKNASYKLMIASLLSPHQTRLLNFSQIADVELTKKIISSLGAKIYSAGERTIFINAADLTSSTVPENLGSVSRAATMFIAPLLARTKKAIVPLPGGDKIGKRPLDRHFAGLKALGAKIEFDNGVFRASCDQLVGAHYRFPKNSHTGTETLIIAAVLAKGKTVIDNAALEPEVDDLINFLNKMGADISRRSERTIEINGVKELQPVIYKVMPDRNEAVSYAIAALATKGDIIVANAQKKHLVAFLDKLKAAGAGFEIGTYGIRFYYQKPLQAVDVTTQPHPGFMSDWQPLWAILATQSQGISTIIESVFSSRFQYAQDLIKMGAKISFFQPQPEKPDDFYNFNLKDDAKSNFHGMKITGITALKGSQVNVTDIRAGATLALAGLVASGTTELDNIELINRGYENFAGRLMDLGAKITQIQ